MASQSNDLEMLCSVPTETEAALLVARLQSEGIDAWEEGGICSGYRAEAPGNANVFVRRSDLQRAVDTLRDDGGPAPPQPQPNHPPTTPGRMPIAPKVNLPWIIVACVVIVTIILGLIGL